MSRNRNGFEASGLDAGGTEISRRRNQEAADTNWHKKQINQILRKKLNHQKKICSKPEVVERGIGIQAVGLIESCGQCSERHKECRRY